MNWEGGERVVKIRLQELAEAQGFTISQVQRRSGLTMTLVRRYWRNETTSVTLEALDVLSNLLHVAPGDLLMKEITESEHRTKGEREPSGDNESSSRR
jgi:transcriptional regulator with XRE-family HTH domain